MADRLAIIRVSKSLAQFDSESCRFDGDDMPARSIFVYVWPGSGLAGRPWDRSADVDALARSARGVCELYSAALAELDLPARSRELRIDLFLDRSRKDVELVVILDLEGEFTRALIPVGIVDLDETARAHLALDVIDAAVRATGAARGWDASVADGAREHVLSQGLTFTWSSPWKAGPGRRHRARACYVIRPDGTARVHLEVAAATADTDPSLIAVSDEAAAWMSYQGFRRSARTLRWNGPDVVSVDPECDPWGGETRPLLLEITTDSATAAPEVRRLATAAPPRPAVTVAAQHVGPEIRYIGGTTSKRTPRRYRATVDRLLDHVGSDPTWLSWWSAASVDVLELEYETVTRHSRSVVRRIGKRLEARIERAESSFSDDLDPEQVARDDVAALLVAVQDKEHLAAPPGLA